MMQPPWFLLILLSSIWGTSFLLISVSLASLTPSEVVLTRLVTGTLLLLIVLKVRRLSLPNLRRDIVAWRSYGILALIGNVLPFYLIAWGQQYVGSGTAGMLMAVMPLTTLLLAHILLPDERLTTLRLAGVLLGASGIWVLLNPEQTGHPKELLAALAILSAALLYSLNAVLAKRLPSSAPLPTALGVLLCASLMTLPLVLLEPQPSPSSLSLTSGLAALWLGLGGTGFATLLYFRIVEQAGATFLANINYLIPVIAFFCGVAVLDEPMTPRSFLALALVLSGITLSRTRRAR